MELRAQQGDATPLHGVMKARNSSCEQAITRIKRDLILDEIAKREGLAVEDGDVEAHLTRLADEERLEYLRRQMEQAGALDSIRHNPLADKVLDVRGGPVCRHRAE